MSLLEVVKSDLAWLSRELRNGTRDRDELRRASSIIRRLLVDSLLQQARRTAGASGQPDLEIYSLAPLLRSAGAENIGLSVAAGCQIDARLVGPFVIDGPSLTDFWASSATRVKLPEFLKAPAVIVKGQTVNRRQIVKYVANKLGGVHFDPSRERKGDEYIRHLESLDEYLVVHPLSVVDVTLLAIIQAMISSPSIMEPFGLVPTAMTLDVPLRSARDEVQVPARSFMRFDLTGDA